MSYNPNNQYRCTIIRGKSQTEMEDMLPFYAQMVHAFCPCTKDEFQSRCTKKLSKLLFDTSDFSSLPDNNQKTVRNHMTEIAGKLLGLYRTDTDDYVYETQSCEFLLETNDFPTFFKNLCANLQFPNGSQKIQTVIERIDNDINIKPLCYVVALLDYARKQPQNIILTKQEIGFYVLNNLDVLQGRVDVKIVYNQLMEDRKRKVKHDNLSGSRDWQHIKEQFNLLDLSNITITDDKFIWLNKDEEAAIRIFVERLAEPLFDMCTYNLTTMEGKKQMFADWEKFYGHFDPRLRSMQSIGIAETQTTEAIRENGAVGLTTVELGDQGELLVYRLECERVKAYKERLLNKVLLLGKTKGLGYDISSIEANENPSRPEFARYIEVKSTKRSTEPTFDRVNWYDTLNLTSKEWIAAEQYGDFYNIYRVYFTKKKTIVIRIKNPFKLSQEDKIEVYPTIYQMNFDSSVIIKQYEQEV
ncbi:MAG: DUF3883 domain-containing protein [Bacteroidaceae bacterium]|nr:DUF3883 domain-containing protein [Bacteroidaceae bacterium]